MKATVETRPTAERTIEIRDSQTLLELARGWLKQGNPIVALELLQTALRTPQAAADNAVRAQILKETGRAYMMQSDWSAAEFNYLEAQQLFITVENFQGGAESSRNRANMFFQRGEYGIAEDLCSQALDMASLAGNNELRATILNTQAAIESATGRHREALKSFRLCLADFQTSHNLIRQGYVLLNIGLCHIELTEYAEATQSLNESLAIAMTEKDLNLVEICYQNIAKCYLGQKEFRLAQSVLDTARRILPGLNSAALDAELMLIEGRINRAMGDFSSAQATLETAYRKAVDHRLAALQADILFEQGQLSRDTGQVDLAVAKLNAASRQYRQLGMDKGFQTAIQAIEQLQRGRHR